MRNLIVAVIALLLAGGAIIRNLLDSDYSKWTLGDWALPIVFLSIGILMLMTHFSKKK